MKTSPASAAQSPRQALSCRAGSGYASKDGTGPVVPGRIDMPKRSIGALIVLNLVLPLVYHFYWLYATKHEMTDRGAEIPTTLLVFIPLVNYYWFWKWSQGVE